MGEKFTKKDTPQIHHIVVVGFHHKKGCQVEYCYPPFNDKTCSTKVTDEDLPVEWKHLPSLALPDGAHNCDKDTIFFHLPCYKTKNRTVFCISCYRQIEAGKLKNKSNDVTRSTVQKSVCVVSSAPLYGFLSAKLEMITQAYFEQCDFEKVELLAEMYDYLKCNVASSPGIVENQALYGLSVRSLAMDFGHMILVLLKLVLLEKRVLFYIFPVRRLCRIILSVLSLFPSLIEHGLEHCLCCSGHTSGPSMDAMACDGGLKGRASSSQAIDKCVDVVEAIQHVGDEQSEDEDSLLRQIEEALNEKFSDENCSFTLASSSKTDASDVQSFSTTACRCNDVQTDKWGFPLQIFSKGSVCHPYLSLAFFDWLNSHHVRSFIVGATNALFRQRRSNLDAIISMDEDGPKIDIIDPDLRKSLSLTTADLRFADFIVKNVNEQRQFSDADENYSNWEGGDEWIRLQFRSYLLALLATVESKEANKLLDFNDHFVLRWLHTRNYKTWAASSHSDVANVLAGHPFSGQIGVADVKLRLAHTIHSTEQGRKINQAVSTTGKYVQQTGRAVGSAVKSAVTQWWQGLQ